MVNRIELGQLLGVHPDTVTDYAKQGMPVVTRGGAGKEGVYNAVACLEWWRGQYGKNAKEAAQTRLYDANAQRAETELQRRRGELVPRHEVILAGQSFVKAWTAKLLIMATRLRHVGAITREQETGVSAFIREEVLTEISTWKTVADAMDSAAKDGRAA